MTTLNLQVGHNDDDAHESDSGGNFHASLGYIKMTASPTDGYRYNGGFRFTTVTVPKAATIDAASVQVYLTSASYDSPNVDILANDVDDAADFSDEADVTSRARTAASESWVDDDLGTGWETSPEIPAVIKEIVDRDGWASGQALCILIDGTTADKGFYAEDYGYPERAAKLDIDYTAGGGAIVEGAAVITGTGALTAAAYAIASGASALSGTGALSASAYAIVFGASALSGLGALEGVGVRIVLGVAALSGTGALAADAFLIVGAEAALSGAGALDADGLAIAFGGAALSGVGALTATGQVIPSGGLVEGAAVLSGAGDLVGTPLVIAVGAGVLAGAGAISCDAIVIVLADATLPGVGSLVGTGTVISGSPTVEGAAVLAGVGGLSALALAIVMGAAGLQGQGRLMAAGESYGTWFRFIIGPMALWEQVHRSSWASNIEPSGYMKRNLAETLWDMP